MKKVLNVFGVLGSIFLTIVLTVLLICYGLLLNLRFVVSKDGIASTLKNIDVVETIKTMDDGSMWTDFEELSVDMGLTTDQFEQILNSDAVKEEVGDIINGIIESVTGDEPYKISKDDFTEMLDVAIDEYNKVAEVKITKDQRDEVVKEINDDFINNINESFEEINLDSMVDQEQKDIVNSIDFILFGKASSILLVAIIVIILIIALFRFSVYKWTGYVGVASLIASGFPLAIALFLTIVPVETIEGIEFIVPIKDVLMNNLYMTAGILFAVYVVLIIINQIGKKTIGRRIRVPKRVENNEIENVQEQVENEEIIKEEQ